MASQSLEEKKASILLISDSVCNWFPKKLSFWAIWDCFFTLGKVQSSLTTMETLKTGEITKTQAKCGWFLANGAQTGDLGTLLNPPVCKTKKESDGEGREIPPRKIFKELKTQTRKPFSFQRDLNTFHMFSPLTWFQCMYPPLARNSRKALPKLFALDKSCFDGWGMMHTPTLCLFQKQFNRTTTEQDCKYLYLDLERINKFAKREDTSGTNVERMRTCTSATQDTTQDLYQQSWPGRIFFATN